VSWADVAVRVGGRRIDGEAADAVTDAVEILRREGHEGGASLSLHYGIDNATRIRARQPFVVVHTKSLLPGCWWNREEWWREIVMLCWRHFGRLLLDRLRLVRARWAPIQSKAKDKRNNRSSD
jgi:hypothetical protein